MEITMKKILTLALALSATALLACPMQQGMMNCGNGPMQGGMMQKCDCNTSQLPKFFEKLGLSDQQKEQIQKLREEGKEFHNKQHEKMMAVFTPEQRAKLDEMRKVRAQKGMMKPSKMSGKMGQPQMPENGMGCKDCDKK